MLKINTETSLKTENTIMQKQNLTDQSQRKDTQTIYRKNTRQ